MNPTLYDILGVSQEATRDEIRQAWREAADRFEPGEGGSTKQFRLFNEAAEVLLDPERRKEYDARLAAEGRAESTEDTPAAEQVPADEPAAPRTETKPEPEEPAGVVPGPPMPGATAAAAPSVPSNDTVRTGAEAEPSVVETEPSLAETAATGGARRRGIPWWAVAVLGVVTAVAVGVAAYLVAEARQAEQYQEALDRAPAAAEAAAAAVLSYSHESLDADRDAAAKYLTDDYRKEYVDTFDKLVKDSATQVKATVEADVLASSAMVLTDDRDPDEVPVLLFVNQSTTSTATTGEPSVALNRVRFDMVRVDGSWRVDGITSY